MNLFLLLTASLRWASPEINHAPLLFTIARDCSQWKYRGAWKAHGYNPVCIDDNRLKQLVWTHCRRAPTLMIQYADIGRHLLLYEHGGWYVDSDVRPTPRCMALKSFPNTTFGLESNFKTSAGAVTALLDDVSQCLSLVNMVLLEIKNLRRLACNLSYCRRSAFCRVKPCVIMFFRTTGPSAVSKLLISQVTQPVSVFGCDSRIRSLLRVPPSCWGCHTFQNSWL